MKTQEELKGQDFVAVFYQGVQIFQGAQRTGLGRLPPPQLEASAACQDLSFVRFQKFRRLFLDIEFIGTPGFVFHAFPDQKNSDFIALLDGEIRQPERVPVGFRGLRGYDNREFHSADSQENRGNRRNPPPNTTKNSAG